MKVAAVAGVALVLALMGANAVLAQGAPAIRLALSDRTPEVGQEVVIAWDVSGAVSVSVRRNGNQVSTDHTGKVTEPVPDKKPVEWKVTASNRNGSETAAVTVKGVSIGSVRSFVVGGNPSGGWVTEIILALIPGVVVIGLSVLKGNISPGPFIAGGIAMPATAFIVEAAMGLVGHYWLATALLVMVVLGIVAWVFLSD